MSMYWFDLTVKGISNDIDTINVWSTNSLENETNLNEIKLSSESLHDIQKIWVEIYGTPTTEPIQLPKDYKCLNITIPIINVISTQVSNEKVMWGMDKFIVRESKKQFNIEAIQRASEYKIKKSKYQ